MKNKAYYALAVIALAVALSGAKVDIRQSPPEPSCPFESWPCTERK